MFLLQESASGYFKIKKRFSKFKNYLQKLSILSPLSEKLARISYLIANDDNKKFNIFHNLLLSNKGPMNDKKLNSVLKDLGYDLKEIEKRMKEN